MVILVYREKEQVAAQFVEKNSNRFTTEVKAHSEKETMTVKKKNSLVWCCDTRTGAPRTGLHQPRAPTGENTKSFQRSKLKL